MLLVSSWSLFGPEARAQWSTDPATNNAICTDYYNQSEPKIVSDGKGGAIISWNDTRSHHNGVFNDEVYVQRIGSNGTILWSSNGIKATTASVWTSSHWMCSDGNGGVFISWHDVVDSNRLRVQHIDSSGTPMWDSSGVIVCSTTLSGQILSKIAGDDNGGVIVAWGDTRSGGSNLEGVYAQRINSAGVAQWLANGVQISDTTGFQGGSLQIAKDGSGGAIIVWEDQRSGSSVEIYAQRVDSYGATLWADNGLQGIYVSGAGLSPQLIGEGGGAIVCWVDRRTGNSDWNIYAQKISAEGQNQWISDGVPVCVKTSNQNTPQLASDQSGGAIITWNELGTGIPDPNIYAQRINAAGSAQWDSTGVGVCTAAGGQGLPQITADGNGGAVITWQDSRPSVTQDIYAQRIDANGAPIWTNNGVAVSTATFVQSHPIVLNDGVGGMIIAWPDYRNDLGGQRNDIFAQRVDNSGSLGGVTDVVERGQLQPATLTLAQNYPNPFNPSTTIRYALPTKSTVRLSVFNTLGQQVAHLVEGEQAAGYHEVQFDASVLPSGVYFYRLTAGSFVETRKLNSLK